MFRCLNSRRPHVRASPALRSASLRTAIAAGQESDQNSAEIYDSVNDCRQNATYPTDDRHDDIPNGLEA